MDVQAVAQLVASFDCGGDGEAVKSRDLSLALLEWSPEPFSRSIYTPGHITCTGAVFSPGRGSVLLVHHARLERWLLPGGHVERGDTTVQAAAAREVLEETGAEIGGSAPILIGIDVHPIPSNGREPLHLHHDLIFAFEAVSMKCQCSEESREVAWREIDKLDEYDLPASIRLSVRRALNF